MTGCFLYMLVSDDVDETVPVVIIDEPVLIGTVVGLDAFKVRKMKDEYEWIFVVKEICLMSNNLSFAH